jgi:hypothetical protein
VISTLGIPAGTVRWRLAEAINRLRARLDDEHGGDRARWRALLLPIAILPVAPASLLIGKKTSLLAGLAGASVLLAAVGSWCSDHRSTDGSPGTALELPARGRRPLPELVQSGATLPADRIAAGGSVEGVVLTPDGEPVAGSEVVLSGASTRRVRSDAPPDQSRFGEERAPSRYRRVHGSWLQHAYPRARLARGQRCSSCGRRLEVTNRMVLPIPRQAVDRPSTGTGGLQRESCSRSAKAVAAQEASATGRDGVPADHRIGPAAGCVDPARVFGGKQVTCSGRVRRCGWRTIAATPEANPQRKAQLHAQPYPHQSHRR